METNRYCISYYCFECRSAGAAMIEKGEEPHQAAERTHKRSRIKCPCGVIVIDPRGTVPVPGAAA